jgi:hypothetical protein
MDTSRPSWKAQRGDYASQLRRGRGGAHVPLHIQLQLVLGTAQVGRSQRDLPRGYQVGRASHDIVHRAHPLFRADAGVHHSALPHEVCDILVLRWMGPGHDCFHRLVPAGDERRAARSHAIGVVKALALVEVRRQGRQPGRFSLTVCDSKSE